MSCGVGHRSGSYLALLWLWRRLVATALIGPLVWEPPYATEAALEKAKRQRKKVKNKWINKYTGQITFLWPNNTALILINSLSLLPFYRNIILKQTTFLSYFIFIYLFIFLSFCLFVFSRAASVAYGNSQARGLIGTVAASLHQSHSNTGSEPSLQTTPQLTATPDP